MEKILQEMSDFGLSVEAITSDGNIHRCNSNAKGKKNKDGWYCIKKHEDVYYAVFGCWVRSEFRKVSNRNSNKESSKIWKILDDQRAYAEIERIKEAKRISAAYLARCNDQAQMDNPYLVNKGVGIWGDLRGHNNKLILPVVNTLGEVISCQEIDEYGNKKFIYKGVITGGCYPIPGDNSLVCICEGYATGATIREATGYKVLVAFNAGNLKFVARHALQMFPAGNIIVCADNDHVTMAKVGFNPGIKEAQKIKTSMGINYVYPTGIDGSDFNDMAAEKGIQSVRDAICCRQTIEYMDRNDCCEQDDDSLIISSDINFKGLIAQGIEALEGDIIQYSLPLVLTVISRAIAGKISINDVHPNVFNIKVGGTSTGKTSTDKKFLTCLACRDMPGFVSLNEVASGAGVWRAVSENPKGMFLFDEVSSLFVRSNNKGSIDIVAEQKNNAFMDLYSRSGQSFKKAYGDTKNAVQIDSPCVSVLGNATPTIFDAIQQKDFETGLMQRFDFWFYAGKIKPKPLIIGSEYRLKTLKWIDNLIKIMEVKPNIPETIASLIKSTVEIHASKKAESKIRDFSDHVVSEANKADSDGQVGFISRRFDLGLKYALVHHAAACGHDALYSDLSIDDVNWGIAIAEMLSNWKIERLVKKVVSGEFHRDCEIFKDAIRMATKAGRLPTFTFMATRKVALKNWEPKHSENIISVLSKRGEIIVKEGRSATQYYLPKNDYVQD